MVGRHVLKYLELIDDFGERVLSRDSLRVQPCPFLFGCSKRALFVPDSVRHPELAEVVYEGCSSQRRGIDGPEPVERTSSRHEVGNRARVTEGER